MKEKISFFDLYEKHKYRGELVLIWITKILKQYSFPIFEYEKFVTENVLYYQISYDKSVKLIMMYFICLNINQMDIQNKVKNYIIKILMDMQYTVIK